LIEVDELMGDTLYRTLVVGLGNPILTDDGVGWRVAQLVRQRLIERSETYPPTDIREACVGGLSLAELLVGYRRAIVVDAIMTINGIPGTVYQLKLTDLPGTLNMASAHDTNLNTALRTLRRYGAEVPPDASVEIVAVEAAEVLSFGERCTTAVEASIPAAADLVMQLLVHQ
jgi:hydrogenase maturation protease